MKKSIAPLKTNSEWLSELPEPFRKKALGNIMLSQAGIFPLEENSLPEALMCSFCWQKTVEGYDYWQNLHQQLLNTKNN